ncbi:MAG: hypothetical protein N2110_08895 [Flavobacteriales bacterium]|nr:hypothetical protein [Flavobacteriales bacterium]MCX7769119.1 hypothetical protein [Flavobacteriales bacterium]MDW8409863.1 hypothetical protein [Flavobacteriales bacterium]
MKKVLFLLLPAIAFIACHQTKMSPSEYNDAIVNEQSKIARLMIDMAQSSAEVEKADSIRQKAVTQAEESLKVLEKLGDYKGEKDLLNAATNLFKFYRDICSNEFKEMYELLKKISEPGADSAAIMTRMEELNTSITDREKPLDEAFAAAQKAFAEKYNIQIKENELQKEINKLSESP